MSTPSEKHSLAYKLSLVRMVLGIDIKAAKQSAISVLTKANRLDMRLNKDGKMMVITI